jgi:hypothetical protein
MVDFDASQAKMRALTLGQNQASSQGPPPQPPQQVPPKHQQQPPQHHHQQQQQQQRRQPHPERQAAPQRDAPRAEPIREAQPKAVPVQRLPREEPSRRPGGPAAVPVTAHDRPERAQAVPAESLPQRDRPRRDKRGRHAEPAGEGHGDAVAVAVPAEPARHAVAARGAGEQRGGRSAAGHNDQVDAPQGAGGSRGPHPELRPRPPRRDQQHQQQQGGIADEQQQQQQDRRVVAVQTGQRLENGDVRERPPRPARAEHGPRAPKREQGEHPQVLFSGTCRTGQFTAFCSL